jgi:hypothetical protein
MMMIARDPSPAAAMQIASRAMQRAASACSRANGLTIEYPQESSASSELLSGCCCSGWMGRVAGGQAGWMRTSPC